MGSTADMDSAKEEIETIEEEIAALRARRKLLIRAVYGKDATSPWRWTSGASGGPELDPEDELAAIKTVIAGVFIAIFFSMVGFIVYAFISWA